MHDQWTGKEDAFLMGNEGKMTFAKMAERLNKTRGQVAGRVRRLKLRAVNAGTSAPPIATCSDRPKVSVEQSDTVLHVETSSTEIKTVEDALKRGNVDMKTWEVERHVLNSWEANAGDGEKVTLWQVKVWLRRRHALEQGNFMDNLVKQVREHAIVRPVSRPKSGKGEKCMYEISVPDLHMGKLSWGQETGEDYDTSIAEERFQHAVHELLNRAGGFPVEKILFPIGNDLLHVDNKLNTTVNGTPQDVDSRWQKSFLRTRDMLVKAIELMRQVAPVDVIIVPGNHDEQRSFYMGVTLAAQYNSTEDVNVDNSPKLRKYVSYGPCLIGFSHGDNERLVDLPMIMAHENKEAWGRCKHREWHLGHYHKKSKIIFGATDTHMGTVVRVLPSLCGADAWHYKHGYVGSVKSAESYVWGETTGFVGQFSSNCFAEDVSA